MANLLRPAALVLAVALAATGCRIEADPETPEAASAEAPQTETAPRPVTPQTPRNAVRADSVRQARTATPPDSASGPSRAVRRDAARDAFEDLVARSDGADARELDRTLDQAQASVATLDRRDRPARVDSLLQVAREAARRGDNVGVALAASQAHQALTASLPPDAPARLLGLGLRLDALARAPLPDWQALRATAADLDARWNRGAGRSLGAPTRDALTQAVEGVRSGAEAQNAPVVRLGASVIRSLSATLEQSAGGQPR